MTQLIATAYPPLRLAADSVDPSARVIGPPDEAERARRRPTPLWQAVLLAALLHLWLAVLLGNVPPGSAAPGQGLWGAINLRLQGHGPADRQDTAVPYQPPLPATGPPGDAATPRSGGMVRAAPPEPQAEPGAALQGDWAAQPAPTIADLPAVQRAPDLATSRSDLPPLAELPPLVARTEPAPLRAPPAVAVQAALPRAPLAAPPPALELPALPAPAAAPSATLAPLSPAAAAQSEPLSSSSPLTTATPGLSPPQWPALPTLAAPPATATQLATPAGLDTERTSVPPLPATAAEAPSPSSPSFNDLPAIGNAPMAAVAPAGRPDAGAQAGTDVATPPSAPASAPRLNLQLPRLRGGELSRLGSGGLLPVLPRPPELKSKLEKQIDGAAKADCRTAHAGAGLLAVVPLALDAMKTEGGCRW